MNVELELFTGVGYRHLPLDQTVMKQSLYEAFATGNLYPCVQLLIRAVGRVHCETWILQIIFTILVILYSFSLPVNTRRLIYTPHHT